MAVRAGANRPPIPLEIPGPGQCRRPFRPTSGPLAVGPDVGREEQVLFKAVRDAWSDESNPGHTSLTRTVPADVPSDFQSSVP